MCFATDGQTNKQSSMQTDRQTDRHRVKYYTAPNHRFYDHKTLRYCHLSGVVFDGGGGGGASSSRCTVLHITKVMSS